MDTETEESYEYEETSDFIETYESEEASESEGTDTHASANMRMGNAYDQMESDINAALVVRDQDNASLTNRLLANLLLTINEQTKDKKAAHVDLLAAVNGQLQRTENPANLFGTVQSIQKSLLKLPQEEKLRDYECGRENGKAWPEDEGYFWQRLNYYERKWKDVATELDHLEKHYDIVGGDREVIKTSLAFRTALCNTIDPLQGINISKYKMAEVKRLKRSKDAKKKTKGFSLENRLQKKCRDYRKTAEQRINQVNETAQKFHNSLYGQKHAFYFRKIGECCKHLEEILNKLDGWHDNYFIPNIVDDFFPRMEGLLFELVAELQEFRNKALPVFLTEEKERIANRYLYITTIATFFSSVTATALAISLQSDNDASTYAAVNLFWFISLIFSVSSGVNSLLGMLWHNSRIFYSSLPPPEVQFWLERSPMVSLIIAALTFVVGLNVYVYVSAQVRQSFMLELMDKMDDPYQDPFVSRATTTFTGLHILCLFSVVLWFLCKLYEGHRWAQLLLGVAEVLRPWVRMLTGTVITSIYSRIMALAQWAKNIFKNVVTVSTTNCKKMMAAYEKQLHLRRNINWAMRLDNRAAMLNTILVQKIELERPDYAMPHLAARVIRAILVPVKLVKECTVFRKAERRPLHLRAGNASQLDLEMAESRLRASQMPWMVTFRISLDRTFDSKVTDTLIAEIDELDWIVCADLAELKRQRNLKLEVLFWGYRGLLEQFKDTCLPHLRECHLRETAYFDNDGYSRRFAVQDGENAYALKVPDADDCVQIKREHDIHIRTKLCHASVLPLLGVSRYFYSAPEGCLHRPCLVLPWMSNGDLMTYVRRHPSNDHISLLLKIAHGLHFLHSLNIIHGNLKPKNVLIDDQGHPKISGIGSALISNLTLPLYRGTSGSTIRYTAPEVLASGFDIEDEDFKEDEANRLKVFTKKTDIYSFACICFEVCTQTAPFHEDMKDVTILRKVIQGLRPQSGGLTNDIWALIERCWAHIPNDRPSMLEVVSELIKIQRIREMQPAPQQIDPMELHPSRYVCRIPFCERRMSN